MSSESHEFLAPVEAARDVSDRSGFCSPPPSKSSASMASPPATMYEKWSHVWSSWKWELLACFLVLATPFMILATLYPHANQPLPNLPFKITINALLSIYNVVFKTSIGFLAASAIGQLQLTWFASRRPLYDVVRLDAAGRRGLGLMYLDMHQPPQAATDNTRGIHFGTLSGLGSVYSANHSLS